MACKEGQFDVVELMVNDQFKTFSINLYVQHVNGMTPFELCTVIRYSRVLYTQRKSIKINVEERFFSKLVNIYIFVDFLEVFLTHRA